MDHRLVIIHFKLNPIAVVYSLILIFHLDIPSIGLTLNEIRPLPLIQIGKLSGAGTRRPPKSYRLIGIPIIVGEPFIGKSGVTWP